jgi:AcrR family transcriptional regulator
LRDEILDAATAMFLERGFGDTSIDAIADRLRIAKRTFYHRFPGKEALFAAVVHRIIDRLRPRAGVPLAEGADLRAALERLAAVILRAALAPQSIALHRMIVAESSRFPELVRVLAREGAVEEAVRLIAGILQRETAAGTLAVDDADFAARQFLHMVIAIPQRRAMGLAARMTRRELAQWPGKVTDLFLDGCRVR